MGQRSRSESVVAVFQAFLKERVWKQPDLARHLGIQVPALKKLLAELETAGMPLDKDEESPQVVYWSVSKDWFPGGILLTGEEAKILLRQLAFLPDGDDKNRLMDAAARGMFGHSGAAHVAREVIAHGEGTTNDQIVGVLFDAARTRTAIRCRYLTTKKGRERTRHLSIQKLAGKKRFVAMCHDTKKLKWFRTDNLREATIDPDEPFRAAPPDELKDFLQTSINGFQGDGPVREYRFSVGGKDAAWVANNLPQGMKTEEADDGIVVVAKTAAIEQVARFVLSLGGAARPETPELRARVGELARGALDASK